MSIILQSNSYGKGQVRFTKVTRQAEQHVLKEVLVNINLAGDFDVAYLNGDNSVVLPTDTMKNTVYGLASQHPVDSIESFGLYLSEHFQQRVPQAHTVTIELSETLWQRVNIAGQPHAHTFLGGNSERRTATITRIAGDVTVEAGISDLLILKTTGSAFVGFIKDEFTTLPEETDRLMGTSLEANWQYADETADFNSVWAQVRQVCIDTFATHESASVQQTMYEMGRIALKKYPEIVEIYLQMPNKHNLPVDLTPFGLENQNEIYQPIDEPFGLIDAWMGRE